MGLLSHIRVFALGFAVAVAAPWMGTSTNSRHVLDSKWPDGPVRRVSKNVEKSYQIASEDGSEIGTGVRHQNDDDDERRRRHKERDLAEHKEARLSLRKKALEKGKNVSTPCETRTVFNVGLPRTGTTSVSSFMDKLGYHSHHIVPYTLEEVDACRNRTSDCGFYEELGAESSEFTAFEDHPTFGLACPLVTRFKDSKFIHVSRPFGAYADSAHYMLCAYVRPDCAHAATAEYLRTQAMMYGNDDILVSFCSKLEKQPSLCHDLGRSPKAKFEWDLSGLKEQWRVVHSAHNEEVRRCVPKDRRLDISLGEADNAKTIHTFLGCKGPVPEFPSHNSAQHPAL